MRKSVHLYMININPSESLDFCEVLCRPLSCFPFYFSHYIVCPSIYGFWLYFWYLQTFIDTKKKIQYFYHVFFNIFFIHVNIFLIHWLTLTVLINYEHFTASNNNFLCNMHCSHAYGQLRQILNIIIQFHYRIEIF